MVNRRHFIQSALAAAPLAGMGSAFAADDFPTKPIKLIVPFSPGGFTDSFARTAALKMAEVLKVPIIVDNRPGAGGTIGATAVVKSPADGYTFMIANNSVMSILPYAMNNPPYDPVKELLPFTLTSRAELFLAVNPDKIKARTVPQLIAEINALPESSPLRAYASAGIATTHHLAMELLKQRTGMKLTHIPYKGSAPAMQDLLAGQVPVMFNTFSEFGQWVKQGKLIAIGTARNARSIDLPDVPTIASQGVANFDVSGWQAFVLPAGTPPAIVRKLHDAYSTAVNDPATRQKFVAMGAPPLVTSTEEASAYIKADAANWSAVIKEANITVND